MAIFRITYRNGEFYYTVWHAAKPPRPENFKPRPETRLERYVDAWHIDMTDEQLDTFSLNQLKQLYAERIAAAKQNFLNKL